MTSSDVEVLRFVITGRKLRSFTDAPPLRAQLPPDMLATLPVFRDDQLWDETVQLITPTTDFSGTLMPPPQFFILELVTRAQLLVNTEGYRYCRRIARLDRPGFEAPRFFVEDDRG